MDDVRTANAEQAALLLDIKLRPLLDFLMRSECSASEAAAHLSVSLQRAHYLLGKLVQAQMAVVERQNASAGRAIKRYSMPGRWFIPYEVTGAETLEAFASAQLIPRIEILIGHSVRVLRERSPHWGFWLESSAGSVNFLIGTQHGPANELFLGDEPFLLNIGRIHLSREKASELKRRLLAVLEDFETEDTPSAPEYTTALMFVRGAVN
ncbi:ArsR family transcriptional regulator [Deinococcus psychrotolerans]|uniref:ArsR family transcriptional regulator n=1 Tax=Deinococcus psychrotolerans TaxID=2489213 RepID=A0A3G8YG56_9DEIO|nr:ArsR family transcriptional regulator [Deinococcus psychrotolerans]AZI44282.1 ArsR family transcriptional regulator [Deinococcus psychrotolerans]